MSQSIQQAVRDRYGSVATSGLSSDQAGVRAIAEAFGYTPQELHAIPAQANMGLSCGNPTAFARLKSGQVVLDLGCGGGLDVFLAARKVGPTGKAIGIDMTPQMIELARKNAAAAAAETGQAMCNIEFHLASIDHMPLPDASVDCVISNCVINLAPDKAAVFREIARVLKPGGRVAVSDIALKRQLPPELAEDVHAYVGCIAGAILIDDYRRAMLDAGLAHVQVIDSGADLNAYAKAADSFGCCSSDHSAPAAAAGSCCSPRAQEPPLHARIAQLVRQYNINDYAASVKVYAIKPD